MNYSERLEMRISPELLKRIDEWRNQQRPIPSRGEAMRILSAMALDLNPVIEPRRAVAKLPQDCT